MVVKDRLKELQDNSKYYKDGAVDEIEMKPLQPKDKLDMQSFFQSAEEIALGLSEIQRNVEEMRTVQRRILTEPSRAERDKFQAQHSDLIDINKSLGGKVQRLIKNEIEANNKLENKTLTSHHLSELKLRKTQIALQASRFLEIWAAYNTLQVEFREKTKAALAKNIKITNNSLSTEDIEEKIDKGEFGAFSSAIIEETAAAKEQLKALENRHQDFIKLEASIREVHSMFIDCNNLVQMQGEIVTRIEDHIHSAGIDVERGREDLDKAGKFKKAALKKKFLCLGILIVAVIIILLIILSEFGAFSSSGTTTTTVVKHEYSIVYHNGTKVVTDEENYSQIKDLQLGSTTESP